MQRYKQRVAVPAPDPATARCQDRVPQLDAVVDYYLLLLSDLPTRGPACRWLQLTTQAPTRLERITSPLTVARDLQERRVAQR
jgi:hypothetical protein